MPEVYGNLEGIRDSVIEELKSLYDFDIGQGEFLPRELALSLARFSFQFRREISVYIARSGEILDITVGENAQVPLKNFRLRRSGKRLSCVRCVHTHPMGSAELSQVDLTALRSMRFDAISAIGIDMEGRVTGVSTAFLGEKADGVPGVRLTPVVSLARLPQEALMNEIMVSEALVLEGEEADEDAPEKAILVGIESEESLQELSALCESAGGVVLATVLQRRQSPDSQSYVGQGRAEQLALDVQAMEADLVIVDDELTSVQNNRLEELLGCRVVDRTMLILDIFAQRAKSGEGKLQVELAQLSYRASHLVGHYTALSRMAGGIGTRRGPGETKLEIDRRRIRERMGDLRAQLAELKTQRALRRRAREKNKVPVVALVGYTNTGKSTLLNALSGASVFVQDTLFATLDAVSRRVALPGGEEFLLVDSVGFIRKLPTELVEAFHSTLEEAVLADILVLVSDASNPNAAAQHEVVEEVLSRLGAVSQKRIEALNKCDLETEGAFAPEGAVRISAKTGEGLDLLLQRIEETIKADHRTVTVVVPFAKYALLGELRASGKILSEEHLDAGTRVTASLDGASLGRLQSKYHDVFSVEEKE